MQTAGPRFLRAGALAEMLGLSERTVRRWIAEGSLPSVKMGGARLVPISALEELLKEADPSCESRPQE